MRLVDREPEPLRLRWYAGELLAIGDAASASEASLRSIERAGWEASPAAREVLGTALRALNREGRSSETRAFLQRAAALKAKATRKE